MAKKFYTQEFNTITLSREEADIIGEQLNRMCIAEESTRSLCKLAKFMLISRDNMVDQYTKDIVNDDTIMLGLIDAMYRFAKPGIASDEGIQRIIDGAIDREISRMPTPLAGRGKPQADAVEPGHTVEEL